MHFEVLTLLHLLVPLAIVLGVWCVREAFRARQAAKRTVEVFAHALRHPGSVKVAVLCGSLNRPALEIVVREHGLIRIHRRIGRHIVQLRRAGVQVDDQRPLYSFEDL